MELGLEGKCVIVTGGGSNIGRAIVHAFASEGCNIVIAELDQAQGERVAHEVAEMDSGATATVVKTDISDHEQVEAMVARTIRESGGVDVLANNAGGTVDRLFMEKSREVGERAGAEPVGPHKLHPSRSSPYDREAGGLPREHRLRCWAYGGVPGGGLLGVQGGCHRLEQGRRP